MGGACAHSARAAIASYHGFYFRPRARIDFAARQDDRATVAEAQTAPSIALNITGRGAFYSRVLRPSGGVLPRCWGSDVHVGPAELTSTRTEFNKKIKSSSLSRRSFDALCPLRCSSILPVRQTEAKNRARS